MPGRLGPRFALEAVFLIALAIAMGLADLSARAIVVVMAVAWLLVAIVEWLASRGAGYEQPPGGWAPYVPREEWRGTPEPVTELAPPPEDDPGAPAAPEDAPARRRRWFRRREADEASRVER